MARRMLSLPACLLAVWIAGPASAGETYPTYRYYGGERVALRLDGSRLAVRLAPAGTIGEIVALAAAAGLPVRTAEPTGLERWFLLVFALPHSSGEEAARRIAPLLASPHVEFVSPVFRGRDGGWAAVTPELLLRFRPAQASRAPGLLTELAPRLRVRQTDFGGLAGGYRLEDPARSGFDVLCTANRLAADPRVEWAEPDWLFTGGGGLIPNDPGFSRLWGMLNTGNLGGVAGMDMDADLAWDLTVGSASVRVLIIDTGVQPDHPDLNVAPGADFTGQGGQGSPVNRCDNHGTAVAGCVSAVINNSLGTVGIAPGTKSVSARTFISDLSCNGSWTSQASWTVNALAYAQSSGFRITNNSNYYGFTSSAIDAKYAATRAAGILHFAVAGNFSRSSLSYPGSIPCVNAVSALNRRGELASFSSYGSGLAFAAPGESIYTTDRTGTDGYTTGDYTTSQGTSFATPYTAGIAALVLSRYPGMSADHVELALRACLDIGTPGYDLSYGWGFVNANSALRVRPYGQGLAGTGGIVPELFVAGRVRIGHPVDLTVARGRGGAPGIAILGFQADAQPFLGGTLLVKPPFLPLAMILSGRSGSAGAGSGAIPFGIPPAPSLVGAHVFFQTGFSDPSAPLGVSLSNAVDVEIGG